MLVLKIFIEPEGLSPVKGKIGDAGFDVFADLSKAGCETMTVHQFSLIKVPLGFRYAFWVNDKVSTDYWMEIKNRSGVGINSGLTEVAAVCDSSYRGIPHYCAVKVTEGEYTISHKQKIAQALIHPFVDPHKIEVQIVSKIEDLGITERADAGFGSTGI